MTRLPTALARLALPLAFGLGCRSAGGSGTATPGAAASGAAGPPLGTYGVEMPTADSAGAAGATWALTLAEGGRFAVTRGGQVAVEGRYRVAADTIVFSGEEGPFACPDATTGPGTYRWRLGRRDLTLTAVTDDCDGRRAAFAARPLSRPGTGTR